MKVKLKKKEFICLVCARIRTRGIFVRLTSLSDLHGLIVKVCKRENCQKIGVRLK